MEDVSKYPELFATLLASGMWTIEDLKKLAGLNFLRVFKEVERVMILDIYKNGVIAEVVGLLSHDCVRVRHTVQNYHTDGPVCDWKYFAGITNVVLYNTS